MRRLDETDGALLFSGEPVIYARRDEQRSIIGVFDQYRHELLVSPHDLPGKPSDADVVTVRGTAYRVVDRLTMPGYVRLRLAVVPPGGRDG